MKVSLINIIYMLRIYDIIVLEIEVLHYYYYKLQL